MSFFYCRNVTGYITYILDHQTVYYVIFKTLMSVILVHRLLGARTLLTANFSVSSHLYLVWSVSRYFLAICSRILSTELQTTALCESTTVYFGWRSLRHHSSFVLPAADYSVFLQSRSKLLKKRLHLLLFGVEVAQDFFGHILSLHLDGLS